MKKYFLLLLLLILLTVCNNAPVTLEKKNISNSDMIDLSLYEKIINKYTKFTKNTTNQCPNINNMAF